MNKELVMTMMYIQAKLLQDLIQTLAFLLQKVLLANKEDLERRDRISNHSLSSY